jgi:hypothetical protein
MSREHIDYEAEADKRNWWLNNTGGAVYGNLTVRDYFAAAAMRGMLASVGTNDEHVDKLVKSAYIKADAMMKERNK